MTYVYEVLLSSLGWDSSFLGVDLMWLLSLHSGNYQNGDCALGHECFRVLALTCWILSSYYSVLYGLSYWQHL
jgi:hypothetical protein